MELTVSIIGFGNIGKFISGILLSSIEHGLHLNIVDTDWHVHGAILDMEHGSQLYSNKSISYNSEDLMNQSDFIFHCAGASVPRGKSRLVTCQNSIEITEAVFKKFKSSKEPFIIVVSNPVEIISFITQRITALPNHKVVGTGTFLDSIRMDHIIKKTNENISSVNSVLLGEHGTTVFLSEQLSTVNGQPFSSVFDEDSIEELMNTVKASAEEIKETQKATIYGVSYCAIRIFETLLVDQKVKIPVSTYIPEHLFVSLGNSPVWLSLMSEINSDGVFSDESYIPNNSELQQLKKSIRLIEPCIPKKYL